MEVMGVVLAGGRGRRMGAPKAGVALAGRPLLAHAVAALRAAGLEAAVVAPAGVVLPQCDAPVWLEPSGPRHPAKGIVAALERAPAVVALAVDLPLVPPGLLRALAALDGTAVPESAGVLQPHVARWDEHALPALREAIARGTPLHAAARAAGAQIVEEADLRAFGDPRRFLLDVNAPEDLVTADELLARPPPAPPRD